MCFSARVDECGAVAVRKRLRRGEVLEFFGRLAPCVVGIEACGSAHYWAREIAALGHWVKLMPPAYVKPHLKRGKNDAAEAICEAVMRPTMAFVPVKSAQQQPSDMAYKVRELLVRRRTQTVNTLRSHLAEMGIVAAQARGKLVKLIAVVREAGNARLPEAVRLALEDLAGQIEALDARLARVDNEIVAKVRASEAGRRLTRILGVGPLLILGAANVLRFMCKNTAVSAWLAAFRERRPFKVVAVALAHKMARIVWP